jgi:hypothetical protein
METVNTLCGVSIILTQAQEVGHMNAPDDEYAPLLLNLAHGLRCQTTSISPNAPRFQRAPEGTGQSASRRGDQIIQRGRVRFMDRRIYFIVLRDL